jgi:hypothetical protein
MVEFHYNVNGDDASFVVEEEVDLGELIAEAERVLLAQLEERELQVDPAEKQYLQSHITLALSRDMLSDEPVDLGSIKVI